MAKATVIGIHTTKSASGDFLMTLHLASEFEKYYDDTDNGRSCEGKKVKILYIGDMAVENLEVGSTIRYSFGEAIKTKKGEIYQPVEELEVIG